jgi:RNA polymerase sigma-70 factor (ECF subfamily)
VDPETPDELELLLRARRFEDREAFGQLVQRYQSRIRDFLRKMTGGDVHLADDLAQETFLRAWRRLDRFRGEASFSTWLFGIACNCCLEARRRLARAAVQTNGAHCAAEPASFRDTPTGLCLDVADALARLEKVERAAILLCCQEGLSHEEAALALGCPLGTLKTHVLRGRQKLQKFLKP